MVEEAPLNFIQNNVARTAKISCYRNSTREIAKKVFAEFTTNQCECSIPNL